MAKVFIGMSGGVDSSVSAALLKEQGYDVVGVFIRVWSPEWMPCTWPEERRDAMRVCAHLEIPFLTFNLEEEYKKGVADYMIEEYKQGRTPNPDVMCNKEIKFGAFYNKAIDMGADFVATGHYARNINGHLFGGVDEDKTQTYFLWNLKKEQMDRVMFPIGDLHKSEVRKEAERLGVPVADKKDSQGVCFLGKLNMKDFLKHYIEEKTGDVLDMEGNKIGKHDGVVFYTFGQRHGFITHKKVTEEKPLFVVGKDIENNTITVSEKRPEEYLKKREASLTKINWINFGPDAGKDYLAQVRYRQDFQKCRVHGNTVLFENPQTLSPGQSVVIYKGDECLGGGIIA